MHLLLMQVSLGFAALIFRRTQVQNLLLNLSLEGPAESLLDAPRIHDPWCAPAPDTWEGATVSVFLLSAS